MRALLLETPGEFNLAPHLDAGCLTGGEDRVVCGNARRHDDEVGPRLDDRVHEGGRVLLSVDLNTGDVVKEE